MLTDKAAAPKIFRNYDERGALRLYSADDRMGCCRRDKDGNILPDMKNKTQEKRSSCCICDGNDKFRLGRYLA